jgi:hypothetical protein
MHMSDNKLTREQLAALKASKSSDIKSKIQDKGLPLRTPAASLLSGSANSGSADGTKGVKKIDCERKPSVKYIFFNS